MSVYAWDAYTPRVVALAGSADVIAAVTDKKIRVLSLFGAATTTGTIKFQSGAAVDLTGAMKLNDGTSLILPFDDRSFWFETAVSAKLNAVLATMTAFDGGLIYVLV